MAEQEASRSALRKFVAPEMVYGNGSRLLSGQYARNLGIQKALLVSDPGVIAAGWTAQVATSLDEAGVQSVWFHEMTPNPKDHEAMQGSVVYQREECAGIVVVGGGSPMDCAKGIGIVSTNGGHILDYEGVDMVQRPCPPLICIPTTAGTAADVSQFAIIHDSAASNKIAVISKAVVPDVSLIDPETTTTMDASLTVATGLDALTHAVEAYVSNASSPLTDLHAKEAVCLVARHLRGAASDLHNLTHREGMMLASLHAGLAFSNASLGLVHAMAHALGGLKGLAHGVCNALLLPHVVEYNLESAPERYAWIGAWIAEIAGGHARRPAEAVREFVNGLLESNGMSNHLSDLGMARGDIGPLAEHALNDPCIVTNPRHPTRTDIEQVYENAF